MIDLEFVKKNKGILINTGFWLLLVISILVFNARRATNYKESIKTITEQKDSLKTVINYRQKQIEFLYQRISSTEMKLDTINYVNGILKNKIKQYEKAVNSIYGMSIDGNIKFLSDYLSSEVSNR